VLSSFHHKQYNTTINGIGVSYIAVNNKTSICYMYDRGWTKILAYFNSSNAGSCVGIVGKTYSGAESNTIVAQIKANTGMAVNQMHFIYTNSTSLGSALAYSNSLSTVTFFDNKFGFFTSVIQNTTAFKGQQPKCKGLVYTNSTASVCSVIVSPSGASGNFGMVNTTELTSSYRVSLYSLVNQSNLVLAHENGVALIGALNVSNVIMWSSMFKDTCSFRNASVGCNVTSFNYSTNMAHLRISSQLSGPIRINTMSCYAIGVQQNYTVGTTIASGGAANVSVQCFSIPVGEVASLYNNYLLAINYTYMNSTRVSGGVLNVTNQALR
jgi:hypothetical protein